MLLLPLANLGLAEGFPAIAHQLGYLTGPPLAGYCETYEGGFQDGRLRDVIEVHADVLTSDNPLVRLGIKEGSPNDTLVYTVDVMQDAFSDRHTFDPPPAGRFVRVRVTSSAATAMNGATLWTELGAPV